MSPSDPRSCPQGAGHAAFVVDPSSVFTALSPFSFLPATTGLQVFPEENAFGAFSMVGTVGHQSHFGPSGGA